MASVWPNVYATVGELRSLKVTEIAHSMGNAWIFLAAVISMMVFLFRAIFSREFTGLRYESVVLLCFWFLAMFFASTRGVRFLVFLVVPLGVFLGWAISDAYAYFRERKNIWATALVCTAFLALSGLFVNRAHTSARMIYPLMDDSWYKVLNLIKEKTPQETIVKGDARSVSIAAASIVAKVSRDRIMEIYHRQFPYYNFFKNKGYGTAEHRQAIREHGFCKIHRRSFHIKETTQENYELILQ